MSRLSDLILQVVSEERDGTGRVDIHHAIGTARDRIDDQDRDTLVDEALGKRLKEAAAKGRKSAERRTSSQMTLLFPGLRDAHAIDIDGRFVKQTDQMTELEMRRVIEIRRTQIDHDRAYLKILEAAYDDVRPFWTASPDKTFGEVCQDLQSLTKRRSAAK